MSATGSKPANGFTLLEMLVVLVLLAIAAAIAAASMSGSLQRAQERRAVNGMLAALRQARLRALTHGTRQWVEFDLRRHTFACRGNRPTSYPASIELQLTTARGLGPRYLFYPDGGSSGGHIVLSGVRHWRLDIAWLTGTTQLRRLP